MSSPHHAAPVAEAQTLAARVIAECRILATMTEDPGKITRRFLTPPVADVHRHLRASMEAVGMIVTVDAVGNLRGVWQPATPTQRRFVLGSHIDTVPDAGAFDGVLGVVLAIELVRLAATASLPLALEVIAFSEEEGVRFGVPFLGSRAIVGRFDPQLLHLRDADGVSIEQAILDFGLNPARLDNAQLDPASTGYLEIHIEQGPVLDSEGLPLGVVTGIVGQSRCELCLTGQANHAGTTPMALRHDALAAAAEWIAKVEEAATPSGTHLVSSPDEDGHRHLVATVGKILVQPNASNVIPGTVQLTLDVRSPQDAVRTAKVDHLLREAESIASRRHLRLESKHVLNQPAVSMDAELTALLAASVEAAGFPVRRLPSGAGHDAMIVGTRIPSAMLFVRSPAGLSHHPGESVHPSDVEAALQVAFLLLKRLSFLL